MRRYALYRVPVLVHHSLQWLQCTQGILIRADSTGFKVHPSIWIIKIHDVLERLTAEASGSMDQSHTSPNGSLSLWSVCILRSFLNPSVLSGLQCTKYCLHLKCQIESQPSLESLVRRSGTSGFGLTVEYLCQARTESLLKHFTPGCEDNAGVLSPGCIVFPERLSNWINICTRLTGRSKK